MTLRAGGGSAPPYKAFNIADHVGDAPEAVAANRERLARCLPSQPLWLKQVHGITAIPAGTHAGSDAPEADAIWTRDHDRVCAVMTADCLPILICNRAGTQVAAIHAGWRGLAAGVIEEALLSFQGHSDHLLAWLGPCIGPTAFEVGAEVYRAFLEDSPLAGSAFRPGITGHWLADLQHLAGIRLMRHGVDDIYVDSSCTYSDHNRFYSFRRDGSTGRMATLIWIAGTTGDA